MKICYGPEYLDTVVAYERFTTDGRHDFDYHIRWSKIRGEYVIERLSPFDFGPKTESLPRNWIFVTWAPSSR